MDATLSLPVTVAFLPIVLSQLIHPLQHYLSEFITEEGLVPVCQVGSNFTLHAPTVFAHQGDGNSPSAQSKISVTIGNDKSRSSDRGKNSTLDWGRAEIISNSSYH